MAEVSILIVCYKSKDLIRQCLDGVYNHTTGVDYEVLLLDCSNDGTMDLVRQEYPKAIIIDNDQNLGYGLGNNVLAAHASGKYILLLNPDVIISDDAVGELYRTAIAMPRAGAVGGWNQLPNGQRDPGCRQFLPTISRILVTALGGARFLNGALKEGEVKAREVETLSGAFMLVRVDVWKEIGGFDPSFFMYSEEMDLCYRLRGLGWSIIMTPQAQVIHLDAGGQGNTPRRVRLLTTSRMHFIRKYWALPKVWLAGFLTWLHGLIRVAIGVAAFPFTGKKWPRNLVEAYAPVVFMPGKWWWGFHANNRS
ncbi:MULTISPECIES: glycosyltransferase family 2 protein [unclassified Schlesneria]|uniref:glycosyltransferase family 2 protein n=1 Tax=Schlesneria TaxID=656899 RepID=UPI0035A15298